MALNFPSRALDIGFGAPFIGAVGQLRGNTGRVAGQEGVAAMSSVTTALTVSALAISGYSRLLGPKVSEKPDVPVTSGTEPTEATPSDVAKVQQQFKALQWAVPADTGALVVVTAYAGEQQRPAVAPGVWQRLYPFKQAA